MAADINYHLRSVIAREFGVPVEQATDDVTVESLGADSLDVIELCMELEEQCNLRVDDERWEKCRTVGDYIHAAIRASSGQERAADG